MLNTEIYLIILPFPSSLRTSKNILEKLVLKVIRLAIWLGYPVTMVTDTQASNERTVALQVQL